MYIICKNSGIWDSWIFEDIIEAIDYIRNSFDDCIIKMSVNRVYKSDTRTVYIRYKYDIANNAIIQSPFSVKDLFLVIKRIEKYEKGF